MNSAPRANSLLQEHRGILRDIANKLFLKKESQCDLQCHWPKTPNSNQS